LIKLHCGLPRIQPINPTRIAAPFDHSNFAFELKHDGFRAVAYIENGKCQLVSRKNIVYKSFAGLTSMMAKLPVKNAILDGELVCLDNDGRSIFLDLRRRSRDTCFYAFDLLWLDGKDLRGLTFLERKSRLRQLVRGRTGFLYAEHVPANE
jgi:bifunctional non-homologous end joining protein LigD